MTEEQFISILPLFRGTVKQARAALAAYPEIQRIDIGVIRKLLGYSGERLKVNGTPEVLEEMIEKYRKKLANFSVDREQFRPAISGNALHEPTLPARRARVPRRPCKTRKAVPG